MAGKKDGDSKIGKIRGTKGARGIERTHEVGDVKEVKSASAVSGVSRARSIGAARVTRNMSLAERDELLRLINEEAEKMFAEGSISPQQRKVVTEAVKMAVDVGLIEEDEEENKKK